MGLGLGFFPSGADCGADGGIEFGHPLAQLFDELGFLFGKVVFFADVFGEVEEHGVLSTGFLVGLEKEFPISLADANEFLAIVVKEFLARGGDVAGEEWGEVHAIDDAVGGQ